MRFLSLLLLIGFWLPGAAPALDPAAYGPPPARPALPVAQTGAPVLENPGFECGQGYHDQDGINGMVPDGWNGVVLLGTNPRPKMCSTQMLFSGGSCDPTNRGFEKLEGHDSYVMLADWKGVGQDFVAPPFDVALYQQVAVTPGVDYSVSGWITSLCGGSASPSDCPGGYYISKMVGLDPTGGTDPLSPNVQWMEDIRPHTEVRWANMRVGARAQGGTITVFVRIKSPFLHHGNHAFADAVKLVRAPAAHFVNLPAEMSNRSLTLSWTGDLGPDIPQIPNQKYQLYYELQYRIGATGQWRDLGIDASATSASFLAASPDPGAEYYFRVRPRAEQPDGTKNGAYPNHRFPGAWTTAGPVRVAAGVPSLARAYLPAVLH
jgi:hypothetical protein